MGLLTRVAPYTYVPGWDEDKYPGFDCDRHY